MRILILTCFSLFIFNVYAQSAKEVGLTFAHKVGDQELKLDETIFSIWNGKKVKLHRAEFYLSGIGIKDEAGVIHHFPDTYLLIRAQEPARKLVLGQLDEMQMDSLVMSVGVDTTKNHDDPTLYPETHPLGLKDPSMHWGWAGGYRFMAIEGMVDNSGDGIPETVFEYHNLGDELYKQAVIGLPEHMDDNDEITIPIVLDYAKLFNQNTMVGSQIVHGSGTKNAAMINNAVNGGFFEIQSISSTNENDPAANWSVIDEGNQLSVQLNGSFLSAYSTITVSDLNGRKLFQDNMTKELDKIVIPKHTMGLSGLVIITLDGTNAQNQSKKVFIR
ncbi:MAG: hypothetical protein IPN29_04530 [Saprospiraceae bacterium]|nr:hypothetical protein [Saprospiraceae bacterium]